MGSIAAVHGPWCNTRTYPTRCRYCGEQVFFFSCDCGCRVFFDPPLGPPWPEHNCNERWIAELGKDTFGELMAWRMMQPGVSIGSTIAPTHGQEMARKAKTHDKVEPMDCPPRPGDETDEVGVVTEVCPMVNLAKALGIPVDTPLGSALLRALGTDKLGRITIQTGSLEDSELWRFVFYVPQSLLNKKSVIRGDILRCKLRAIGVPGLAPVWFSDTIIGAW